MTLRIPAVFATPMCAWPGAFQCGSTITAFLLGAGNQRAWTVLFSG